MKKYKYIKASDIESYNDWDIVQIIPGETRDFIVMMKKDKPLQAYIKLHEATDEQLLEELHRRLIKNCKN